MSEKCLICEEVFENKRALASHLQAKHDTTSRQYTISYLLNNVIPLCPVCNVEPRYVGFTFKKYCKEHSHFAESSAGRLGGKNKKTWNKGKTKHSDDRLLDFSIKFSGSGNPFFGKKHNPKTITNQKHQKLLSQEEFEERVKNRADQFEVLNSYQDYFSRQHQYLRMKCVKCGKITKKTLQTFERNSPCPFCTPVKTISKFEAEVLAFIESLGIQNIQKNDRNTIAPHELDIFLPEYNFAIECNGLYWHSELYKDKKYHKEKTNACRQQDIQLFHIFEDEWEQKRSIVESMIRNRLKLTKQTIYARKCEVKQVDNRFQVDLFFDKTHISGKCKHKTAFGLFYKGDLVACVSLRKPIQKKYQDTIEIARFSTIKETNIPGAFSKIMKEVEIWAKKEGYRSILTYADLRFGVGNLYKSIDYEELGDTTLDYWYTDGLDRFNRFKFRAQKPLTEKQVAEMAGVYRIYGCGNRHFRKVLI